MKKLKALLVAICLILVILIFNIPDINYGRGPNNVNAPDYSSGYGYDEEEYVGDD